MAAFFWQNIDKNLIRDPICLALLYFYVFSTEQEKAGGIRKTGNTRRRKEGRERRKEGRKRNVFIACVLQGPLSRGS